RGYCRSIPNQELPVPTLNDVAKQLVAPRMGILAADESEGTIAKRFAVIGLPVTFETRRDYREMLFRSREAMSKYITGVILTEETLTQSAADGTPFVALLADTDVMPGIKVDRGAFAMPGTTGEKITEGLDGLRQRLDNYRRLGAKFAKWRGVIAVSDYAPSRNGIRANAHVLARYAATADEIAAQTLAVLKAEVPSEIPGIAFLSGGQSDEAATANLSAMNRLGPHPWPLTFSYGRAL